VCQPFDNNDGLLQAPMQDKDVEAAFGLQRMVVCNSMSHPRLRIFPTQIHVFMNPKKLRTLNFHTAQSISKGNVIIHLQGSR
jgi:hypothetical protein